ncbi:hypothetical protein [Pelagibius sp.]|uniref:hypothetical protein n=1 Tax=Pelagibius sp. TaxID=1931238 RepID=UPI00260BFACF|nr:hypothetical protein [Pelagibius sp.]
MIALLKRQLEVWRWVGEMELDLSRLPITLRQAPAPLNAMLLAVLGLAGIVTAVVAGAVLGTSGQLHSTAVQLLTLPPLGGGIGLLYVAVLSHRSRRDLAFASDGVTVRGRWLRRTENWYAPYSAFDGVEARAERVLRGHFYRIFQVIELRHPEPEKSIPLFVCAADSGPGETVLRQKARDYAQAIGISVL